MLSKYASELENAVEKASEIYDGAVFLFENAYTIVAVGAVALIVIVLLICKLYQIIEKQNREIEDLKREIFTINQNIINQTNLIQQTSMRYNRSQNENHF